MGASDGRMIAITFALPAESSEIVRRLTHKSASKSGNVSTLSGRLGMHEVHIVHTGVGEIMARSRLNHYLQDKTPSILISSGFAGATHDDYQLGDLIVARNFSDPKLVASAENILREENVRTVVGWTAKSVVDSSKEREQVWTRHEAAAIDMESAPIAEICGRHGVPMLSLRVLSDTPRHPLPLPPEILFDVERQRTPALPLLGYVAAHPSSIPKLIRFGQEVARIRRRLTNALIKVVESDLSV